MGEKSRTSPLAGAPSLVTVAGNRVAAPKRKLLVPDTRIAAI